MTKLKLKVLLVALAVILLAGFLDAEGRGEGGERRGRGQGRARGRNRTRSRSSFNNRSHERLHLDLPSDDGGGYSDGGYSDGGYGGGGYDGGRYGDGYGDDKYGYDGYGYDKYGYDGYGYDKRSDDSDCWLVFLGGVGVVLVLRFLYWLMMTCSNLCKQNCQRQLQRREDRCERQEETVSGQELDRMRLLIPLQPLDESTRSNVSGTLHEDHKDIQNQLEEESTPPPPYESPQSYYNTGANATEDNDRQEMTLQPEDIA